MSYVSPDGEEGFPGTIHANLVVEVLDDDALQLTMTAETDADTIINMTHHGYFNLRGHDMGDLQQHCLRVNAERYLAVDGDMLPTGELRNCLEDFGLSPDSIPTLGQVFHLAKEQASLDGVDHTFILRRSGNVAKDEEIPAATFYDPSSGRIMRVRGGGGAEAGGT
jgi:aldose 1-epimerase